MLAQASISVPSTEKCSSDNKALTRAQHRRHELRGDVTGNQPLAVLGEYRHIPHRGIQRQPDKPAEQQIVPQLLHQLPLRAHRIEGLQQQGTQQFLRRNRGSARLGIEFLKLRRQRHQRLVHNLADRPQWMIHWHPRVTAHVAEQRFCPRIPTAHPTSPNISSRSGHYRQHLGHILDLFRNLLVFCPVKSLT
jgi:hypothetical protein